MSEFMFSDQTNETTASRLQRVAGLIGMSILYAGIITGITVKSLQERAFGQHSIEARDASVGHLPIPEDHDNPFQS